MASAICAQGPLKSVEWFFDFVSPFSYLRFERVGEVEHLGKVTMMPVVLAGVLKHWGQKGPAEIPAKRRFTYRFIQWQAERLGIPLKFPPTQPFNPLKALRLAIPAMRMHGISCVKTWGYAIQTR
jgi:2-hydroxychromene-2-carboxylate isomerase